MHEDKRHKEKGEEKARALEIMLDDQPPKRKEKRLEGFEDRLRSCLNK